MKIYTKTGDQGQTSLTQGLRVDKDDALVIWLPSAEELLGS